MGVAKQVVVDAAADAGAVCGVADGFAQVFVWLHGCGVEKQRPGVVDFFEPCSEGGVQAFGDDGDGAPFAAFAEDVEQHGFELDVFGGELEGFSPAQAGVMVEVDGQPGYGVALFCQPGDFVGGGNAEFRRFDFFVFGDDERQIRELVFLYGPGDEGGEVGELFVDGAPADGFCRAFASGDIIPPLVFADLLYRESCQF